MAYARTLREFLQGTPAPAPTAALPPTVAKLTGAREERLARLAKAMNGNQAQLDRAIADGTSPDDFAVLCADALIAERAAAAERVEIETIAMAILAA
jgi:hypothetical protein